MGVPPAARDRPLAYLAALEEELRKIQAFQRELPLSLDLVARTIEDFKQEVLATPVLEEFIPLKGSSSGPDGEGERSEDSDAQDKADWLRSAQLWNQQQQQQLNVEMPGTDAMEAEGPPPADGEGSDAGSEGGRGAAAAADQMRKKERRCWSADLHRKFVDALQRLGGPEVATPKQIKELMSVDGLTNDEIKSHLQKYRKRLNKSAAQPTAAVNAAVNQQPQVLLGIWVPQGDYAAVAAAAAAAISSLPVEPKQKKQRKAKQARRNGAGPVVIWPQNATSTGSNTTSI